MGFVKCLGPANGEHVGPSSLVLVLVLVLSGVPESDSG
jgi:hypothetical protein